MFESAENYISRLDRLVRLSRGGDVDKRIILALVYELIKVIEEHLVFGED